MYQPDWPSVVAAANEDSETLLALKNASFCAAIGVGDRRVLLEFDDGLVRIADPARAANFEVRAPASTWAAYASGPGLKTNTVMSMARQGQLSGDHSESSGFEFDGDQRKLWANFRALDQVLQQLRRGGSES